MRTKFKYFLSLPKSIYFNLKYFELKHAMKLPILISYNTWLKDTKGSIKINKKDIKTGMIKIGFGDVGVFDAKKSRSIWEQKGDSIVNFEGNAKIGHGSKISVSKGSNLSFGENFIITAESSIICQNKIVFGDECLVSWENLFMDSDFHDIYDDQGNIINKSEPIIVGDKVWFGCRNTVLKGSKIPNETVIGTGSVINKKFYVENILIAGVPGKIIMDNINWVK